MRTFEYLILILDAAILVLLLFPNRRPRYLLICTSIITLVVLFVHLLLEGFRWQMTLAFLLTVGLLLAALIQGRFGMEKPERAWRLALLAFIGLVLIVVAAALPFLLPVPHLPDPGGPYAIGTTTYHLEDINRPEIFGESPGGNRELMLQIWYPADPGTAEEPAPWFDQLDIAASVISERLGLPSFFLGHLNLVKTHALINAFPHSDAAPYPLLLFSHGLSGLRMQNTALFEELASNGYIVASVDHTYDSVITILPEGRVILHHGQTVMPEGVPTVQSGRRLLDVRVQDLTSVLAFLEDQNRKNDSLLLGRMDMQKIGVMGHSTGGGTAIEFCAQSTQCQAVLALDSWVEPVSDAAISSALPQPSMFLNTPEWLGNDNQSTGKTFFDLQDQDSYQVTIEEMGHNNFTDVPLLTPISAQIGIGGPINGARGIQIVNDYSLAFFERYLRGSDNPLLETIADQYWEVSFQSN